MILVNHLQEFHGLPVFDFPGAEARVKLPDAEAVAWRISAPTYSNPKDEQWVPQFERFLKEVDADRVRALVIGGWDEAYENSSADVIAALVGANTRLTGLAAVFVGDMVSEDCEISWIVQSDVTPLLAAYPDLEGLGVRGGSELAFPPVRHTALKSLVVETGGLGAEVVRGIAGSDLPSLEGMELWLGTDEYGGDSTPEDLGPLLAGTAFPSLRRLGLRNSVVQDAVAAAVAGAPVVARIEELDLSLGVLTDEGAAALLDGQPLTHLTRLDLSHHYLSEPMQERLTAALVPHGVTLVLDDPQQAEDDGDGDVWRYVAVAE
ncbi:STM4015 family protein [Streptomyces sp. NPDC058877]|uniref:STM4015 family protein n=1 Tax=Streptomyces sp. NPDC058877 TaxID=3346665 RepID=UPI0036A131D2